MSIFFLQAVAAHFLSVSLFSHARAGPRKKEGMIKELRRLNSQGGEGAGGAESSPQIEDDIVESPTHQSPTTRARLAQIPSSDAAVIMTRQQQLEDDLLKKITFSAEEGYTYKDHPLKPCCHFYHHVTKYWPAHGSDQVDPEAKNLHTPLRIRVRIPPTLVGGIKDSLVLFYTDHMGMMCRVDNATVKTFKQYLSLKVKDTIPMHGMEAAKGKDAEVEKNQPPVTVIKRPKYSGNCSEIHCLTAKQTILNVTNLQYSQVTVVQRFVKSKGPTATITRLVWLNGKGCYAYQIGNKIKYDEVHKEKDSSKRWLASSEVPNSLNIFKMKGKALEELFGMAKELIALVTNTVKPKPKFQTFVADFIKDQDGVWWYIQTKAFTLAPECLVSHMPGAPGRIGKKKAHVMRTHVCAICNVPHRPQELEFSLTLKMIHDMEQHLKQHGRHLAWFDRPEFRVAQTALWYQPLRVCKSCFDLYTQEQKLEQAELLFAKVIGIPVDSEQRQIASVLAAFNKKRRQLIQATGCHTLSPDPCAESPKKSRVPGTPLLQAPAPNLMTMYRLLLFFYEIHHVPSNIEGPLYLKLDFLFTTLKLPIRMALDPANPTSLPLNKIRVFHFFTSPVPEDAKSPPHSPFNAQCPATSPKTMSPMSPLSLGAKSFANVEPKFTPAEPKGKGINAELRHFLQQQEDLVVHLWQPGAGSLGHCRLPLHQFEGGLIEKLDYVKFFSLPSSQLCSLKATLGIIRGRTIPVDDIALKKSPHGVWVPAEDFFSVDPLPAEWMQLVISRGADPGPPIKSAEDKGSPREGPKKRGGYSTPMREAFQGWRPTKTQRRVSEAPKGTRGRPQPRGKSAQAAASAQPRQTVQLKTGSLAVSSALLQGKSSPKPTAADRAYRDSPFDEPCRPTPPQRKTSHFSDGQPGPKHPHSPEPLQETPAHPQEGAGVAGLPRNADHSASCRNARPPHAAPSGGGGVPSRVRQLLGSQGLPLSVWCVQVHVQTVIDVFSAVDESWVVTYALFGHEVRHESFQLFKHGPLVFDAEKFFHVYSADPNAFLKYLKESKLVITLAQKYNVLTLREVDVTLQPLVMEAQGNAQKEAWTGAVVQGLYPLETKSVLKLDARTGDSVLSPNDSRQSQADSPQNNARKHKRKRKKRIVDSNTLGTKIFNIINDDVEKGEEGAELFQGHAAGETSEPEKAAGDDDDLELSAAATEDLPKEDTEAVTGSSLSSPKGGRGTPSGGEEEDDDAGKPQLVLVLKVSKVQLWKAPQPISTVECSHGPLVLLNTPLP